MKPLVDVILSNEEKTMSPSTKTNSSRQELPNQGAGLIRRTYPSSALSFPCNCTGSDGVNEPYASMLKHLPKDQSILIGETLLQRVSVCCSAT